jgi:hypothetical protein
MSGCELREQTKMHRWGCALGILGLGLSAAACADHSSSIHSRSARTGTASEAKVSKGTIQGERTIKGTVEEIAGGQIKVDTGEPQPRYLPLKAGGEEAASFRKGDAIDIVVNEQNLVVSYHRPGEINTRVLRGALAESLPVGQDRAVIKTEEGKELSFYVSPLAKAKLAALPVNEPAEFVLNEQDQIADLHVKSSGGHGGAEGIGSTPKSVHTRLDATVISANETELRVRTADDQEKTYAVRPLIGSRVASLSKGEDLAIFLDSENYVIDIAKAKPIR